MGDQINSWNYEAEDSTYDLSIADIGINLPGVYRGFDMTLEGTMVLKMTHQDTGYVVTDLAGGTISGKRGAIVSRQGVVITEDDTETLPVGVGDVTNDRIDVVIVDHQYTQVTGGQLAIYSIVQGTPSASPVVPTLPNTALQVPIGELLIPSGTTALNDVGVVWTRYPVPYVTAEKVVTENRENTFSRINTFVDFTKFITSVTFGVSLDKDITLTDAPDNSPALNLSLDKGGNYFLLEDPSLHGVIRFIAHPLVEFTSAIPITIEIGNDTIFRHDETPTAAELAAGFRKIVHKKTNLDLSVVVGQYVTIVWFKSEWHIMNVY
jgi:hypothetical protein